MASRACRKCAFVRWPLGWDNCPACNYPLIRDARSPSRTEHEARQANFHRQYRKREADRLRCLDPMPEVTGFLEAREAIDMERDLERRAA